MVHPLLLLPLCFLSPGQGQGDVVRVEPWGRNSIRVRSAPAGSTIDDSAPGALDPQPPPSTAGPARPAGDGLSASSGALRCSHDVQGRLQCFRGAELLLHEAEPRAWGSTRYPGISNLTLSFALQPDEQIWGLGQTPTDSLDASGTCQDTAPSNGHILIPLAHSSRGVSFLLNLPSMGQVCVDAHGAPDRRFRWYSRGAIQFDIWVTASASPAAALPAALEAYVAATGRPSPFPHWTTGFWQSKNRCKF